MMAAAWAILFDDSSESSDENSSDADQNVSHPSFTINAIPERLLVHRTRLNRRAFMRVHNLLAADLTRDTRKGRRLHLTPMQKLYVTLQFYATGSLQRLVASNGGISQPAASRAIRDVTDALIKLAPRFIRFPDDRDKVKADFYRLGKIRHGKGFPNVLGAIDSTHIRIQVPCKNSEQYLNEKNDHSIKMQLIVGADLRIYNAFAEYPGSNEDSYIWSNSSVRDGFSEGNFPDGWLLGDSSYPQEPWLMTPVSNAKTPAEHLYNSIHVSTRSVVEKGSAVLKSRWHVLDSPLAYAPGRVCAIAVACCVLHNICIEYKD